jgi:hypothetical protein
MTMDTPTTQRLSFIKAIRSLANCGLGDAKGYVDAILAGEDLEKWEEILKPPVAQTPPTPEEEPLKGDIFIPLGEVRLLEWCLQDISIDTTVRDDDIPF